MASRSSRAGLRHVLLVLLRREPSTGYGLARLLAQELDHVWSARLQQIYEELHVLNKDGLVQHQAIEQTNRPAKKVYSITPLGEEEVERWLRQDSAPGAARDALLVKLLALSRSTAPAVKQGLMRRKQVCEERRQDLWARLSRLAHRTDWAAIGEALALEGALARTDAELAWCERAVEVLRTAQPKALEIASRREA